MEKKIKNKLDYLELMGNKEEDLATFTLLNPETIRRLEKDGEVKVPKKKIEVPKDQQWNMKTLGSKLLQGIQNGDSVHKIAEGFGEVIKNNEVSAIRNARTMTTSAECHGRMDSYESLAKQGVIQKKHWIATGDNRTRDTHLELDGQERDINEAFSNGLMFPGDANGEPSEVWNCRCSIATKIVGFRKADGSVAKVADVNEPESLHEKQIKEEREKRGLPEPEKTKQEEKEPEESYADRIKAIKQNAASITQDEIYEAGKIMANEMNKKIEAIKKESEKTIKDYEKKKAEYDKIMEEKNRKSKIINTKRMDLSKIYDAIDYGEINPKKFSYKKIEGFEDEFGEIIKVLKDKPEKEDFMNVYNKLEEIKAKLINEDIQLEKENKDIIEEFKQLRDKYNKINIFKFSLDNADILKDLLSEIRPMGITEDMNIDKHLNNSKSQAKNDLVRAYNYYPTSWIQQSIDYGKIKTGTTARGFYNDTTSELKLSGKGDYAVEAAIHELGHRFEYSVSGLMSQEAEFYKERTKGSSLEWLGPGFRESEKTRKDDFINAYMGKDYGGDGYELVSMGFPLAFTNPMELQKDPDMYEWILGLLSVYGGE